MTYLASLAAFLATLLGTRAFSVLAVRKGIVANPNFRSLHQRPMPRAGGIVFAAAFVVMAGLLVMATGGDRRVVLGLVAGGAAAGLFGLIDDIVQFGPVTQLLAQCTLAAWSLWCFGGNPLADLPWSPHWVDLSLSWAGLVWLMNLYNFMDGVDGMAASGSVFFSLTAIVLLLFANPDPVVLAVLGVLTAAVLGFLVFNWPPASIFMGSAGSFFLGYCYCALIAQTVIGGSMTLSAWLVMFGYFAGDTTTTTVLRFFITPQWYREHRSHAYQNLARLCGSHRRIVTGVTLYHVVWLLPLAVWVTVVPSAAPLVVALAFTPVVIWTIWYGPRLSSA